MLNLQIESLLEDYPKDKIMLEDNQFDRLLAGISYQKRLLDSVTPDTNYYWEIKSNIQEAIEQLSLEVSK